jgi:serine/threonine-protein kinase RsbW
MGGMTMLPAAVPQPAGVELGSWTLDSFRGLHELRAAVREAAGSGQVSDRMSVVVTELTTNALRHGRPPAVVRLLHAGDRLVIDVADHDLTALPELAEDRPLGTGGLGLQLTKRFATELGWYTTDVTKHVWASFPS